MRLDPRSRDPAVLLDWKWLFTTRRCGEESAIHNVQQIYLIYLIYLGCLPGHKYTVLASGSQHPELHSLRAYEVRAPRG